MAQLVLTAASSAARAVGQAGIGQALASSAASTIANFAASSVSSLIFGPRKRRVEGPRLENFQVQASTEGAPMLRVFGRARVSGQVIWAANFKETISQEVEGGKGNRAGTQTTTVNYIYSISLAVALGEGEINRVGRIWADGKPFDRSGQTIRFYTGARDQLPDPVIEMLEGNENAPAFRDTAYVVFEDLVLTEFGNRIPQFSFEIENSLDTDDENGLEQLITGVSIIPASGEFVYGTTPVSRVLAPGAHVNENTNNNQGATDFSVSMGMLANTLPRLKHTSLIVSWFGDDLRVGECRLRPGVETRDKQTFPYDWSVSGDIRDYAYEISKQNNRPAFGGTPCDASVVEALIRLLGEGWEVMFHPFILMDIPANSGLPHPSGNGTQSAFPWRGRIQAGQLDGSDMARDAVASFFGTAQISDFIAQQDGIHYTGPQDYSLRRMVLHYAHLCKLAQDRVGADIGSFLIGSELRGITTIRDDDGNYPAIAHLRALAQDVKTILGPDIAISYGADWSEYSGHQPDDNSGTRNFHLDPFWADDAVDFIGIDNYMPLSDWRPGAGHFDQSANTDNGPYSVAYLAENIQGGEGYDWFYASEDDRVAQNRTPISDGAYHEPWVFRVKDLWNWWSRPHHNRPNGNRLASATPWIPQSKPIRFTEIGCPAIDNGAAQPNVFVDPKSIENALPYFSRGTRDDLAQRRFLEAQLGFWRIEDNNPTSSLYGGPMVDPDRHYVYAWDARPYPDFPARNEIWGDTQNWTLGHWLNGRLGRAPLSLLIEALAGQAGPVPIDTHQLEGVLTGYVIDRPLSPREMIDPLADVFQFDMVETSAGLRFQPRYASLTSAMSPIALNIEQLVATQESASPFSRSEHQAIDLPSAFRLGFIDDGADLTPAVAAARDPGLRSARESSTSITAVLAMEEAQARARSVLADAWVMREQMSFALPPTFLWLEPGDVISFADEESDRTYRITEIDDGNVRSVNLVRFSASVYDAPSQSAVFRPSPSPAQTNAPVDWHLFDLPTLGDDEIPGAPRFAAFAHPWPGQALLYRQSTDAVVSARTLSAQTDAPCIIGRLVSALSPAPSGRWIHQDMEIELYNETLMSRPQEEVLAGANGVLVQSASQEMEVLQFAQAEIIGPNRWRLSRLLRGQAGSEQQALAGAAAGSFVVVLPNGIDSARAPVAVRVSQNLFGGDYHWQGGPAKGDPEGVTFTSKNFTPTGRNLRPLSPVHLRVHRLAGLRKISWLRRTRLGGDRWEGEDVPLGEAFESYRVNVYGADQLVRQVTVNQPEWLYRDDLYERDLAGAGPSAQGLSVSVSQHSDIIGQGDLSLPIILT